MKAVYGIKCKINNRVYIGSTNNVDLRFFQHYKLLNLGKHTNPELQRDFTLYGESNFSRGVIEEYKGTSRAHLYRLEDRWLNKISNKYNVQSATAHLTNKKPVQRPLKKEDKRSIVDKPVAVKAKTKKVSGFSYKAVKPNIGKILQAKVNKLKKRKSKY